MALSPTLQPLDQKLDDIRARATRTQNSLQARISEIQGDGALSDQGKQAAITEEKASTKAYLATLRAEEQEAVDNLIEQLQRRIEGQVGYSSADIIAFRDAQDRAERLKDSADAETVLDRAIRTNDRTLAHAAFRRALEAQWPSVIKKFGEYDSVAAEAAEDLHTLTTFRDNDSIQRALLYGVR